MIGVSVPHYWLGMVLVIIFSVAARLAAADRRRARRLGRLGLGLGAHPLPDPAGHHHVGDPDGHHHAHRARAGRRDPVAGVRRRRCGPRACATTGVFRHVVKNAAPTALAVMGLQLGYLLGGSILIETVFSWPGTGFLLNCAIFQRDLPLLQGTILVLAMFFVLLNLSSTCCRPRSIRASSGADAMSIQSIARCSRTAVQADRAIERARLLGDGRPPPRARSGEHGLRRRDPAADRRSRRSSRRGSRSPIPIRASMIRRLQPHRHAGLSARHRRARPRHALAPDLWRRGCRCSWA